MIKQSAAVVAASMLGFAAQAQDGAWSVYAGADYVMHEVSITRNVPPANPEPGPGNNGRTVREDGDGNSVRLRAGMWLSEDFSIEVQGNVDSDALEGDESAEIDSYYGVFVNVRAQPFDWLDVLFPIGFAAVDANVRYQDDNGDFQVASMSEERAAFGMNLQLRLGEMLTDPDSLIAGLGVGLGFMVYSPSGDANVRGYNAGIQFGLDF